MSKHRISDSDLQAMKGALADLAKVKKPARAVEPKAALDSLAQVNFELPSVVPLPGTEGYLHQFARRLCREPYVWADGPGFFSVILNDWDATRELLTTFDLWKQWARGGHMHQFVFAREQEATVRGILARIKRGAVT